MRRERGSILVFTLWVLIILAIFSIILSRRTSTEVKLAGYESRNIKAAYLARAGVMKMLLELAKDTNSYDSLNEDWNRTKDNPKKLILRNDTVLYGASDEMARLNLNSVSLKKEYLINLGIDAATAQQIVDYKNGKGSKGFEFIEELFLVEGMTRKKYSVIKGLITIYRGDDPKININTAGETVLDAVIQDNILTQEVLDHRRGPDGEEGSEDDGVFRDASDISTISGLDPALFTLKSNVFRIWVHAFLSENEEAAKAAEAVADKKTGNIYYWKEY